MPDHPAECLAYDEDLSALIDGELDTEREGEVRAHVDACAHCTERMQALCNVDLALASVPAPTVSADLASRLQARLAEDAPAEVTPLRRRERAPRRTPVLRYAVGFAAAAAILLAVLLVMPRDGAEPGTRVAENEAPLPESVPEVVDPAPSLDEPLPEPSLIAEEAEPLREVAPPVVDEPTPAPALVPEQLAVADPAPAPEAAFDAISDEDLALAIDLDAVEELELMANLDLLETLVDLGIAEGA